MGKDKIIKSADRQYYPNMDLVRYLLSLAVIIAHINELTGFRIPFFISSYEAVGAFFALSGFLMYPNYIRHNSFLKYTRQRARRILPPYFFIVILAAIFLVFTSTLSFGQYFASGGFWAYLAANLSFLNWLHPGLPGVFTGTEFITPAVNASLWTMKVEWCLYFSVPVFVYLLTRFKHIHRHWLALTVIVLSIGYRLVFTYLYAKTGKEIYNILARQIFGQLAYFYCGMIIFFVKDFFQHHPFMIIVVSLIVYTLSPLSTEWRIILNPFVISSLVLAVSLVPVNLKWLYHRGNVSYEMYLFHFPIVQLSIFLGIFHKGSWVEFAFVIGATVILSIIAHIGIKRVINHQ